MGCQADIDNLSNILNEIPSNLNGRLLNIQFISADNYYYNAHINIKNFYNGKIIINNPNAITCLSGDYIDGIINIENCTDVEISNLKLYNIAFSENSVNKPNDNIAAHPCCIYTKGVKSLNINYVTGQCIYYHDNRIFKQPSTFINHLEDYNFTAILKSFKTKSVIITNSNFLHATIMAFAYCNTKITWLENNNIYLGTLNEYISDNLFNNYTQNMTSIINYAAGNSNILFKYLSMNVEQTGFIFNKIYSPQVNDASQIFPNESLISKINNIYVNSYDKSAAYNKIIKLIDTFARASFIKFRICSTRIII